METRKLTKEELERLANLEYQGPWDLALTCEADEGYGPCGTWLEWYDGRCSEGHEIEIEIEEEQ